MHLPLDFGGRVVDAAAGGSACAAVNDRGLVHVWGYGILGQGPQVSRHVFPVFFLLGIARYYVCILDCRLHRPSLLPSALFGDCAVRRILSSCMHFGALTENNELYTWGRNRFGLLGLGHDKDQYFPFKVCLAHDVKQVALGPDHTMALAVT